MTEFKVMWEIDVSAENEAAAALAALKIQRDPASIATVFLVVPYCTACSEHHDEDAKLVDLTMETTRAH